MRVTRHDGEFVSLAGSPEWNERIEVWLCIGCVCLQREPSPEQDAQIQIPEALKKWLMDDWDFVTRQKQVRDQSTLWEDAINRGQLNFLVMFCTSTQSNLHKKNTFLIKFSNCNKMLDVLQTQLYCTMVCFGVR